MNIDIFDRKDYLDRNWDSNRTKIVHKITLKNNHTIINVNLTRATSKEASSLKRYLKNLSFNETYPIVIDLSNCSFIDLTYLNVIMNFNKSINNQVKLVVKDNRQITLFRITKISSIFNVYSNIIQATQF